MNNDKHFYEAPSPWEGLRFCSVAIFALCLTVGCVHLIDRERSQIKEDVRRLLNDIDDGGDTDKYLCGPDYVERLWSWSHNQ